MASAFMPKVLFRKFLDIIKNKEFMDRIFKQKYYYI